MSVHHVVFPRTTETIFLVEDNGPTPAIIVSNHYHEDEANNLIIFFSGSVYFGGNGEEMNPIYHTGESWPLDTTINTQVSPQE